MIFVVDGRETKSANKLPQSETSEQQMLEFEKPNTKCQKSIGLLLKPRYIKSINSFDSKDDDHFFDMNGGNLHFFVFQTKSFRFGLTHKFHSTN